MDNQISKRPIQEKKIHRRYDSWPIGKIIPKPGPEPKLNLAVELKRKGNNIKCVTFDFGGVYTRTDIMSDVFAAYKSKYGVDPESLWRKVHDSEHWDKFFKGKITEPEFWAGVKQEFDSSGFDGEFFSKRLKESSEDVNPRMESLVARLKSMGYKTAMLTNNSREWFEPFVRGGHLNDFDFILTSYDLGLKKPERMIYDILLNVVEVRPGECVFIDDLERNTEAARRMGIHAITFKSYEQVLGELEELLGKKIF
jgi:epoxide hydrolase-like predicted phosphatase